jgi:tRNA A-37 threonylcarbamoyl transferase component Bud32
VSWDAFQVMDGVFAIGGEELRSHKGRSVVAVSINGHRFFLKRFWFVPSRPYKRNVARGLHELRMIDWLNSHGFAGPKVVRRGLGKAFLLKTRLFFLMEDMPRESALETVCRNYPDKVDSILAALASFTARLHDAGFVHTDFSERHIFVGGEECRWTFRLIDLERASVGRFREGLAAADLATLAASVADPRLREKINSDFLDAYVTRRRTLASGLEFRQLFAVASPTKSF